MDSDESLLDRPRGFLSETQRAIMLSSNLIDAGAQLPASIDFASILMSDHGLWYLQNICPTFDITEIGNLSPPNQWIFACLVRTVSACHESVCRQLQGFPIKALQFYMSAKRLADEINSSQEFFRHRFLLSLSVGGSRSMLEALLFHGLSMGDLSTYYFEKATERGRINIAHLLLSYGASLSLETSTRLLEHMKPDLEMFIRDSSKSEAFCHFLERALESSGPLQDLDGEHAIFESLVLIFQWAVLLSDLQHINYGRLSSKDYIYDKVVRLLLEAGLFRDSKLPARYWSFGHCIDESPLTLAIRGCNKHAIRLLIENGYDVDELCHFKSLPIDHYCMENKGTPLTYAIWLGFIEAVTLLLEAGADVTIKGAQGQTAPELSKKCLQLPVAKTSIGGAKDTSLEDCEHDADSRQRIFTMVCTSLKTTHGMEFEYFVNEVQRHAYWGTCLRFAGL